jgi:hypothetical protein
VYMHCAASICDIAALSLNLSIWGFPFGCERCIGAFVVAVDGRVVRYVGDVVLHSVLVEKENR